MQVLKKCFDGFADEEGAIPADQVFVFPRVAPEIILSLGWRNPCHDGDEGEAVSTEGDH